MNVFVKALVAALALVLSIIGGEVLADSRHQGMIIVDGTICDDGLDNTDSPPILDSGTIVSILPDNTDDGKQLIGIGVDSSYACSVLEDSVIPWDGEPLPDQPYEEELKVIGDDYINADDTPCLTAPFDGDVVTYLVRGEYVVLIADGLQDGWQRVGIEATTCYVDFANIGIPAEVPPVTVPEEPVEEIVETAPEPEVAEVTPEPVIIQSPSEPATVSAEAEIASVTQLPKAGVGNENEKPTDFLLIIAAILVAALLVLLAILAWKLAKKAKAKNKEFLRWINCTEQCS